MATYVPCCKNTTRMAKKERLQERSKNMPSAFQEHSQSIPKAFPKHSKNIQVVPLYDKKHESTT